MVDYEALTEFITYYNDQLNCITEWQTRGELDQQALTVLIEVIHNDLCSGWCNSELYALYQHIKENREEYEEALLSGNICNVSDLMEDIFIE